VLWPPNDPRSLSPTAHLPPKPSKPLKPRAKSYPFPLDPFQRVAIDALESGHSVLVAAHTSAGKTVVAEYAFAMAIRDKSRAIYTSPLKALSNQKYRELAEEFKDVGLLTGDVTINPNASCLVMTTEILRSMLYGGSDAVREAGLIVFDEVHYLRDAERGVVWEEAISLAPPGASLAFLSATLPNAAEFAAWVAASAGMGSGLVVGGSGSGKVGGGGGRELAPPPSSSAAAAEAEASNLQPLQQSSSSSRHHLHLHRRPCHVVYTEYRPTPLQMYVFPAGGDGLFLTVDEKGTFKEAAFAKAVACLEDSAAAEATAMAANGGKNKKSASSSSGPSSSYSNGLVSPPSGEKSDIFRVVKMVVDRRYDPLIVFSFSKRDCETHAASLAALDLNSREESESVDAVFWAALDCLAEEDRKNLPQVSSLLPALRRGVGVHHSGLLPILKEVVELLFQEGLVKVLFATETFSTGLNMPAKIVVFTGVRKFDGGTFRWLTGGEFTQMAGRAGRRGLDDKGVVVLMMDSRMEPPAARAMLRGSSDPLTSAFRLSYGSLLTMARSADASPEQLLSSSFAQWQARAALPELARKREQAERAVGEAEAEAEKEKEKGSDSGSDSDALVSEVVGMRDALAAAEEARRVAALVPSVCLPFVQPGRLVRLAAAAATGKGGSGEKGGESGGGEEVKASSSSSTPACWGVVVRFERVRGRGTSSAPDDIAVDVLCRVPKKKKKGKETAKKMTKTTKKGDGDDDDAAAASSPSFLPIGAPSSSSSSSSSSELVVASLRLSDVATFSSVRVYLPEDLRPQEAKEAAARAVAEVERRFAEKQQKEKEKEENGSAIPLLDPVTDMGLDSDAYRSASARATSLREALRSHPLSTDPKLESKISALRRRQGLAAALAAAVASERDAAGLFLGSELRARVRVLRKLGYLEEAEEGGNGGEGTVRVDDDRSVVTVKGRAAAELSWAGGAELALAEALFGGGLSGMRPEHLAALLSCLVWQEPSSGGGGGNSGGSNAASAVLARVGGAPPPPRAPEALDGPLAALRAAARRVSRVERDVGLFDESSGSGGGAGTAGSSSSSSGSPDDAAAALLSTEPADAVLAWARGARFVDALRLCGGSGSSSNRPAFEGSLVRALRRVDELLRQLGSAAEVLGDETLVALAKVAGDKVRRGVPFAPSLYL